MLESFAPVPTGSEVKAQLYVRFTARPQPAFTPVRDALSRSPLVPSSRTVAVVPTVAWFFATPCPCCQAIAAVGPWPPHKPTWTKVYVVLVERPNASISCSVTSYSPLASGVKLGF